MTTLAAAISTLHPSHIIIWLPYKHTCKCKLMHLSSLSNTSAICMLLETHLLTAEYHTVNLCYYDRKWLRTPSKVEIRTLELEQHVAIPLDPATANPKATMWGNIHANYPPNPRPSYIACNPPSDNTPPPAIQATVKSSSRLISSTIFQWATNHSFDANYSDCFRQGADDHTLCLCADPNHPQYIPTHTYCPYRHTNEHDLFHCPRYTTARHTHLCGLTSLRIIFHSEEDTTRLCAFAAATNCSLLHLLHNLAPWPDPL